MTSPARSTQACALVVDDERDIRELLVLTLGRMGLRCDTAASLTAQVKAQDRNGKEIRIKAYDWLARIFLHEIDHLHGVLMTDKATQIYKLVKGEDGEIEAVPLEEAPVVRRAVNPQATAA